MSAAVVSIAQPMRPHTRQILPRVWATSTIAIASEAVQQRRRSQCLRLVRAGARESVAERVAQLPRTRRSALAGLAFYRVYTEGLLRRYATMSMENGRVPSLLGRELFAGHVTSCKVKSFDDASNFVHDVGNCMKELSPGVAHLVRRIALEGYTQQETAALLGLSLRTVVTKYADGLDKLTRIFLDRKLMEPMMESRMQEE
jgi:hypothetical protein